MRTSRFTEEQILSVLKEKEGEAGVTVAEIIRKHGISRNTYFNWKSRCGGATITELRRLRVLEAENAKLKRLYAELAVENAALKDVAHRKW
jgi:putative transposase